MPVPEDAFVVVARGRATRRGRWPARGLAGCPAKAAPPGVHKPTDDVVEHLEGLREADPGRGRGCPGRRAR
jgi:hypothetical protein